MHPYLNIAVKAARLAGKIIVDATLHPNSVKIAKKSNSTLDVVTNVDQACEEAIIKTILRAYPEHNIKAEETGECNNNSDITWIIDPLDGTLNFAHGLPLFAVSIAVINNKQIEHGVIYNPISDELFVASRGSGAKLNNKRIRCTNNKFPDVLLAIDPNLLLQYNKNNNLGLEKLLPSCRESGIINRYFGSAALQLAFVAAGRLDGYCDCDLKSWDIAAGALLVREAGGYVTDFNGQNDFLVNGNIIAANIMIQQQLLKVCSS